MGVALSNLFGNEQLCSFQFSLVPPPFAPPNRNSDLDLDRHQLPPRLPALLLAIQWPHFWLQKSSQPFAPLIHSICFRFIASPLAFSPTRSLLETPLAAPPNTPVITRYCNSNTLLNYSSLFQLGGRQKSHLNCKPLKSLNTNEAKENSAKQKISYDSSSSARNLLTR